MATIMCQTYWQKLQSAPSARPQFRSHSINFSHMANAVWQGRKPENMFCNLAHEVDRVVVL